MERLLKPEDLAELLSVSVATIYTWANRRQIPFQKVGHALRFSPAALSRWLSEQAHPALSDLDRNDG